jgi:6-phosphogluconolactonase
MTASVEVATVDALRERFASIVERAARRAVADRDAFTIAVPGGSAAEHLLPRLTRAAVEWKRTDVFWVDERAVPLDAPDSNARGALAGWVEKVPLPVERVHVMPAAAADLDDAARAYEKTMRGVLGERPSIDVVLLGVGPDGHVASLFPGHPALDEDSRWVAPVLDAPKPPPVRMTVTLPVLRAAREIVVYATGAAKAQAIADALKGRDSKLPLALVLSRGASATILLDAEAASALRPPIR